MHHRLLVRSMQNSSLMGANFAGATLAGVDLRNASMAGINLRGAKLSGTAPSSRRSAPDDTSLEGAQMGGEAILVSFEAFDILTHTYVVLDTNTPRQIKEAFAPYIGVYGQNLVAAAALWHAVSTANGRALTWS
jgi:uncharacterized protein YjbI with pentapeptide repeats